MYSQMGKHNIYYQYIVLGLPELVQHDQKLANKIYYKINIDSHISKERDKYYKY